jgi:ubiquitin-conjugating enzyme E2 J1
MAEEAKGQVGGMDMEKVGRERLARESGAWRCGVCGGGKGLKEVMEEVAEKVKQVEHEGGEKSKEEEVPEELARGLREGMKEERKKGDEEKEERKKGDEEKEKGGDVEGESKAEAGAATSRPEELPARPAQGVSKPTRTISQEQSASELQASSRLPAVTTPARLPSQLPSQASQQQMQQQRQSQDNGVPPWLDRAIMGVVACLGFMIIKRLVGF